MTAWTRAGEEAASGPRSTVCAAGDPARFLHCAALVSLMYRVTVDTRQHFTDRSGGMLRFVENRECAIVPGNPSPLPGFFPRNTEENISRCVLYLQTRNRTVCTL